MSSSNSQFFSDKLIVLPTSIELFTVFLDTRQTTVTIELRIYLYFSKLLFNIINFQFYCKLKETSVWTKPLTKLLSCTA